MAPDFKSYLVSQIVAEGQTITYRNVSRTLKVHVNAAKCMLYDFWEKENKKKAGLIYATYLIAGTKKQDPKPASTNGTTDHNDDEDEPMPSSPPPFTSSMLESSQQNGHSEPVAEVPVKTITLAREENLDAIKAQYDNITSIHIYSLSPGRLQDLAALTDISRGLYADTISKEDPLINNKTYGLIENPGVRRRTGKRPTLTAVASTSKFQPTKDNKKQSLKPAATSTTTTKPEATESSRPTSRESSVSTTSTKQPPLKRDGSNLFKAFAKAQSKPKLTREATDASTNASASGAEDIKLATAAAAADDDDEGESEDDALFLDTGTQKRGGKKRTSDAKKEREDKRAKLRKMMDSDDEAEPAPKGEDAAEVKHEQPSAETKKEAEPAADDPEAEEVAWSDSDTERQKAPVARENEAACAPNRRRRARRQVPKKRTMKDEDGYLVTKEELVWESFSEDEPEVVTKEKSKQSAFSSFKSTPSSQKSASGTAKKKANIMSFFGKK